MAETNGGVPYIGDPQNNIPGAVPMEQNMPIGLAMALAQNTEAMQNFARMSPEAQENLLACARNTHSREDMRRLVREVASGAAPHPMDPYYE